MQLPRWGDEIAEYGFVTYGGGGGLGKWRERNSRMMFFLFYSIERHKLFLMQGGVYTSLLPYNIQNTVICRVDAVYHLVSHQKETLCDSVQFSIAWMGEFNYL